jgi:multimeric flavodoxin WrbA
MPKLRILAINGSHRKGNTEFMLHELLDEVKKQGNEVYEIKLRKKNIRFCNAGDYCCSRSGKCDINDDMLHINQLLELADIIILASPSYFSNVTALMKNFMDRCNPYWFNKKLKGKKAFLIGVGGSGDKSINEMLSIMRTFIRILGIDEIGSYYAKADKAGELEKNSKVIKELRELGFKLTENAKR